MFEIRVPASSANLGPGFDSLGIALNIYGRFVFESTSDKEDRRHLAIKAYRKTLEQLGVSGPALSVRTPQIIPVGKGLGSSAACIVAGVLAAKHVSEHEIETQELLRLAAMIEGHPDNVTPAMLGGLVASGWREEMLLHGKLSFSRKLALALLIPSFPLPTLKARRVLPKTVSFKDATYNLSQLSLTLSALASGDEQQIRHAFDDRLHQPYRFPLIDDAEQLIALAKDNGALAVMLSGAGPSLLIIRKKGDRLGTLGSALKPLKKRWKLRLCGLDMKGAQVREL